MKRRWNILVWVGFVVSVAAMLGYAFFFARFPALRNSPGLVLLLSMVGLGMLVAGLRQAFRQPQLYCGKVTGTIFVTLGALLVGGFVFSVYHQARGLPASKGAPQVGAKAPEFALTDQDGKTVTLASLLTSPPSSAAGGANQTTAVLLIFYRGYW